MSTHRTLLSTMAAALTLTLSVSANAYYDSLPAPATWSDLGTGQYNSFASSTGSGSYRDVDLSSLQSGTASAPGFRFYGRLYSRLRVHSRGVVELLDATDPQTGPAVPSPNLQVSHPRPYSYQGGGPFPSVRNPVPTLAPLWTEGNPRATGIRTYANSGGLGSGAVEIVWYNSATPLFGLRLKDSGNFAFIYRPSGAGGAWQAADLGETASIGYATDEFDAVRRGSLGLGFGASFRSSYFVSSLPVVSTKYRVVEWKFPGDGTAYARATTDAAWDTSPPEDRAGGASATASSTYPLPTCRPSNANDGDTATEWCSNAGKAGSWIQLDWPADELKVSKIVLRDRPNATDQVTSATIQIGSGREIRTLTVGTLPNDGSPYEVAVAPAMRDVSWVKVTVNAVSAGSQNIGLAELQVIAQQSLWRYGQRFSMGGVYANPEQALTHDGWVRLTSGYPWPVISHAGSDRYFDGFDSYADSAMSLTGNQFYFTSLRARVTPMGAGTAAATNTLTGKPARLTWWNRANDVNCQQARSRYLSEYPDVAAAGVDPYQHYMSYGARESRTWRSELCPHKKLLIVPGYDPVPTQQMVTLPYGAGTVPGNVGDDGPAKYLVLLKGLVPIAQQAGFDIGIGDLSDGGVDLHSQQQDVALWVVEALRQDTSATVQVVGISEGGILVRDALARNDIAPNNDLPGGALCKCSASPGCTCGRGTFNMVNAWYTVDSPHLGANGGAAKRGDAYQGIQTFLACRRSDLPAQFTNYLEPQPRAGVPRVAWKAAQQLVQAVVDPSRCSCDSDGSVDAMSDRCPVSSTEHNQYYATLGWPPATKPHYAISFADVLGRSDMKGRPLHPTNVTGGFSTNDKLWFFHRGSLTDAWWYGSSRDCTPGSRLLETSLFPGGSEGLELRWAPSWIGVDSSLAAQTEFGINETTLDSECRGAGLGKFTVPYWTEFWGNTENGSHLGLPTGPGVVAAGGTTFSHNYTGSATATAAASSVYGVGYEARNVTDGWFRTEWAARGTTGASITLTLSGPSTLTAVRLADRPNDVDQIKSGRLDFKVGSTVVSSMTVGTLGNDGAAKTITFAPINGVTSVTFTITLAAGSNTGLSEFQLYGNTLAPLGDTVMRWLLTNQ